LSLFVNPLDDAAVLDLNNYWLKKKYKLICHLCLKGKKTKTEEERERMKGWKTEGQKE
jgi:hypothetical protein